MKVWITCFILLFGAAELLQWVKQFSLPLPIFVLGGLFLAIASNYSKLSHLPFHLDYKDPEPLKPEAPKPPAVPVAQGSPVTSSKRTSSRSISFEINKNFQPGDNLRQKR